MFEKKLEDKRPESMKKNDIVINSDDTTLKNPDKTNTPISETWSTDSLEELEDWIEEQGYQLRF